jgi:hypothetical protein
VQTTDLLSVPQYSGRRRDGPAVETVNMTTVNLAQLETFRIMIIVYSANQLKRS